MGTGEGGRRPDEGRGENLNNPVTKAGLQSNFQEQEATLQENPASFPGQSGFLRGKLATMAIDFYLLP
jgi:hypothetical protein